MPAEGEVYEGPVGFGSDGIHYPLDEEGHLITTQGLRWDVNDEVYKFAAANAPLHNDVHHQRLAELPVGGEG